MDSVRGGEKSMAINQYSATVTETERRTLTALHTLLSVKVMLSFSKPSRFMEEWRYGSTKS
jgi:hypothetical protein